MSNEFVDRALERVDRAAAGLPERESKLDGLHPLIEKSQSDDVFRSDNSGLREAGREVTERRRHPVKELIDESMPDGVREVKIVGRDGNAADPKATFKQMDLRRVAADLADDRKLTAADERERYRAFEDGRDYDVGVALEDYAVDAAWRKFGEKTPEEIEHIRRTDPDQYQEMMRIAEQYRVSQEAQRSQEQPQAEHQVPEADRQAQEQAQHQARVQAEQARLVEEQTRATLTQYTQQLQTEARDIVNTLQYFPELAQGVTPQQLEQHLRATDPQRHALLLQTSQRIRNAESAGHQIQAVATQLDASSNVAQKQQFENYKKNQSAILESARPELKDPVKSAQIKAEVAEYLTKDRNIPVDQLRWHYENNPHFHSAEFQGIVLDAVQHRRAQQQMTNLNNKLAKAPPVQRPGTGQHRAHESEQIGSLSAKLDRTGNMRDAVKLLMAKRSAAKR